ncbi:MULTISPECIES: winged helix-turn-helix transcriptional regulator [unclassified Gilliamella]|nr:hypothetical protein [Gilliamella sp. Lep-s35]MWP69115.1 hypothetical protein [Gilliamella sp. Lep-s5]MWP77455.1 hypothetical protein [Gilliamella sp. Lep-s21]
MKDQHPLITQCVFADKPPLKVVYKLTLYGERLKLVLEQLCLWALNV